MVAPRYFDEDRTDLRFKPPAEHKTFKIAKLWDLHREIVRRVALGETNKEIAEALGISVETVRYTKGSRAGQDQLAILRGAMDADTIDLGMRIQKFAPIALELLEKIIRAEGDCKDASLALRAKHADKYLDRAGYSPVKKIASLNGQLTREDIEDIKNRAVSAARDSNIIEAEIVSGN